MPSRRFSFRLPAAATDGRRPQAGVLFRSAAKTEVWANRYITLTDGLILVIASATLTGPPTLIARVKCQDDLSQTTFDATLAQG